MALLFEERAENTLREIQTERMVYQINSSSDARKASNKMKKGIDEIIKAMENARNTTYEKKVTTDEMKISLSEKKDKLKKLQHELERARKHVELSAKKTLGFEMEINKITNAMEKIEEATHDLDKKYTEQSKSELMNFFVKITTDAEKAQSDLNAAKRTESAISKKLLEIETDVNRLELDVRDKTDEVERIASNVSTTIDHIIRSYDEITTVSKDLLKSATSASTEFREEEQNYNTDGNQPHQEVNETRIAI
mgnify:CR=1 FL=1